MMSILPGSCETEVARTGVAFSSLYTIPTLANSQFTPIETTETPMSKPGHKVKKANHGARPANSKMRKQKRHRVKT